MHLIKVQTKAPGFILYKQLDFEEERILKMSTPETPVKIEAIDITPTWGEMMQQYIRFAESGEKRVVRELRSEVAKAAAAAQALHEILSSLTDEQAATVSVVMVRELGKMGF